MISLSIAPLKHKADRATLRRDCLAKVVKSFQMWHHRRLEKFAQKIVAVALEHRFMFLRDDAVRTGKIY